MHSDTIAVYYRGQLFICSCATMRNQGLALFFPLITVSAFLLSSCIPCYVGEKSDHFNGKVFHNRHPPEIKSVNHYNYSTDDWFVGNLNSWASIVNVQPVDVPPRRVWDDIRVSYVGHSTWLIQVDGINIITDPVFSSYLGSIPFLGYRRVAKPGIDFSQLPRIDVVIISSNHYDHLDLESIRKIGYRDNPVILVPLGNEIFVDSAFRYSFNIIQMDWGKSFRFNQDLTLILEPSLSHSSRWIGDTNKALWGSFILKSRLGNIYFAGETYYGDHFKCLGNKYGGFRLALLPIGTSINEPGMDPTRAVCAHKELKSNISIAMHFSTFPSRITRLSSLMNMLHYSKRKEGVAPNEFLIMQEGEYIFVP